jgi:ribonuclease I
MAMTAPTVKFEDWIKLGVCNQTDPESFFLKKVRRFEKQNESALGVKFKWLASNGLSQAASVLASGAV